MCLAAIARYAAAVTFGVTSDSGSLLLTSFSFDVDKICCYYMQLSTSCLGISGLVLSAARRLQLPRHCFAVCRRGLFNSKVTLHKDETSQAQTFPSPVERRIERKPVKQAEYVVPGNLLATLAAHRESNNLRRLQNQVDGAEKITTAVKNGAEKTTTAVKDGAKKTTTAVKDGGEKTTTAVKDGMKAVHAEESGEKPANNGQASIIRPRKSARLGKHQLFQVLKAKSTRNHGLAIIDPKKYSNGTYVRTAKYQGQGKGTSPWPYQPWKRALRNVECLDRHER